MQVVIDIDEEVIEHAKAQSEDSNDEWKAMRAIANGTPLPPHGRLIDADRVITEATERMKYPANYQYMECVIAHMKLAPTIIEADKENEE